MRRVWRVFFSAVDTPRMSAAVSPRPGEFPPGCGVRRQLRAHSEARKPRRTAGGVGRVAGETDTRRAGLPGGPRPSGHRGTVRTRPGDAWTPGPACPAALRAHTAQTGAFPPPAPLLKRVKSGSAAGYDEKNKMGKVTFC